MIAKGGGSSCEGHPLRHFNPIAAPANLKERPGSQLGPEVSWRPIEIPLRRMNGELTGISFQLGVDALDQIAFHDRYHVVGSGECNNDFERILWRSAVEQDARHRVGEHTRLCFDKRAYPFHCLIELGILCNGKPHLAGMRWGGINAEIAQRLAPDSTVWHDYLDLVVGHQLRPE